MIDLATLAILVGLAMVGAMAHLCLKYGAQKRRPGSFISFFFHPGVVAGVALTAFNSVALSAIMRSLPLTVVMPTTSLVYIFVPLGAVLVFKEKVKPRFWGGGFLIIAGIAVLNFR
jgi:EamA-like transporter family.